MVKVVKAKNKNPREGARDARTRETGAHFFHLMSEKRRKGQKKSF